MAEFVNAALIGNFKVAPTAAQLEIIRRYDTATGSAGRRGQIDRPASFDIISLATQVQVPSGGAANSVEFSCPWPLLLAAIDGAVEAFGAGLSALTFDVQVDRGAGFVTVLDAPEDIFALGAGVSARVAPEDTLEELAFGDKVRITWAATGGTADGASVKLITKRL